MGGELGLGCGLELRLGDCGVGFICRWFRGFKVNEDMQFFFNLFLEGLGFRGLGFRIV